jgi:AmpE protein
MALALLAILIVLVLGSVAPELTRLRQFLWLRDYLAWLDLRFEGRGLWRTEFGLALIVIPIVLVAALIDWALADALKGLLRFAYGTVVLFLCWGPRDLDADARRAARAETAADRVEALGALGVDSPETQTRSSDLVEAVFAAGLTRWFAPLFWFVAFGPAGALAYRLLQLLAQSADLRGRLPVLQAEAAERLHAALAWLPAQLMTLALALASDFDTVARAWREHHEAHGQGFLYLDLGFLSATARAAVDLDDEEFATEDGAPISNVAVEEARRLLWRVLIVWMALLAVVVIAGWAS